MYGEILKELRLDKNLTQMQLGNFIGATQNQISKWEQGVFEPNTELLCILADFFEVSVDYLLGREDGVNKYSSYPLTSVKTIKTEVQELFDLLNIAEQSRALGYMQSMLESKSVNYIKKA